MKYAYLTLSMVLFALLGCSDGNPVGLTDSSAPPPEMAMANMNHEAPKQRGPKMVPIKGRWTAQAAPDAVPVVCLGPNEQPTDVSLPSTIIAQGQVTHLGRTHTVISGDWCEVDFIERTVTASGTAVHTGANGDAIVARYRNVTSLDDGTFRSENIAFVDGTGRFEGVEGSASSQGVFDFSTATGSFSIEGMITSVGSSR